MSPRLILLAIASTMLLAACGETTDDQSVADQAPQTVTVTETVAAAPTAEPEPEPTAEPEEEIDAEPARSDSSSRPADCITVPGVEGGDHQLAQDTMQAAGLYALSEEDATGQDRSLIIDRNWTVVEQRPAAGECVSDDTTILLRSKKDDE